MTTLNLFWVDATELDALLTKEVTKTAVLKKFPSFFQGLENLGEEFEIHLKPDAVPYSLFTPRHMPLPLRLQMQEELICKESIVVI